jgi:hypothetical protein
VVAKPLEAQRQNLIDANIDLNSKHEIMTPEEVAQYLRKSLSWVYKHWQVLGGRKLGGFLFFSGKENLYEHIFGQREGVEIRLHSKRKQVHKCLVQNKNRGKTIRGKEKGKAEETTTISADPNRHGLLGAGK